MSLFFQTYFLKLSHFNEQLRSGVFFLLQFQDNFSELSSDFKNQLVLFTSEKELFQR